MFNNISVEKDTDYYIQLRQNKVCGSHLISYNSQNRNQKTKNNCKQKYSTVNKYYSDTIDTEASYNTSFCREPW